MWAMQQEPWVALFSRVCIQQTWFSVFRVLEVVGGCVRRGAACLQDKGTSLGVEVGLHSWGDWPGTGGVGLGEKRLHLVLHFFLSLYGSTQYLKSDHLSVCWL